MMEILRKLQFQRGFRGGFHCGITRFRAAEDMDLPKFLVVTGRIPQGNQMTEATLKLDDPVCFHKGYADRNQPGTSRFRKVSADGNHPGSSRFSLFQQDGIQRYN